MVHKTTPTPGASAQSITLDPAPKDTVSRVSFSPDSRDLLVSTWASSLTIHASDTGTLRTEAKRHVAPLLDADWRNETTLTAASLNGDVLLTKLTESTVEPWKILGRHESAARVILPSVGPSSVILTGGWDSTINLWDPNSSAAANKIASVNATAKVFGAAKSGPNNAIVITSDRHVRILDIRNTSAFLHDRIPPKLTYQLRGISATKNGAQYAVGSTEGRVAVEWIDEPTKSFSFRCHRVDGFVYPVNCVAHNDRYDTFATGGGDGHVAFWDGEARKRIVQFPRYPTSISSLDFDESKRMAIAVSYTFEEGEKDHPPDEVHIRSLDDSHIATKQSEDAQNEGHQSKEPPQTEIRPQT